MEEWRTIQETLGKYAVSPHGQIRHIRTGRMVSPWIGKRGYYTFKASIDGKLKNFCVHQMVAKYFVGTLDETLTVNHIDTNRLNNHVSNLEYITQLANVEHARLMGLIPKGERVSSAKLTEALVAQARRLKPVLTYEELGFLTGVDKRTIRSAVKRRTWKHVA